MTSYENKNIKLNAHGDLTDETGRMASNHVVYDFIKRKESEIVRIKKSYSELQIINQESLDYIQKLVKERSELIRENDKMKIEIFKLAEKFKSGES